MTKPKILWLDTATDLYEVKRGIEAAKNLGVTLTALDIHDVQFAADGTQIGAFHKGKNLTEHYDVLIVRAFIPMISESLTLARLFKEAGKIVIDDSLTTEGYAMSKIHDYVVLAKAGVAVPRTQQFSDQNQLIAAADTLGYPCVIKGGHGSFGRHVHKAGDAEELKRKLMKYKPGEVMVQEYLDAPVDYRVVVIGYKALPVYVSRQPQSGDFRTNFELNEIVAAEPLMEADHLRDLAERAARALKREFSGVDIRCRGSTPLVLEANRRPGYKDFERITGFDVATAFLEYAVEKYRNR